MSALDMNINDIHFVCDDDSVELCEDDRKILENLFRLSDKSEEDESDSLQSLNLNLNENSSELRLLNTVKNNDDLNNNVTGEINRNVKGNLTIILEYKMFHFLKNNKLFSE